VAGFCEHGNGSLRLVINGKYLDRLREYWFVRKELLVAGEMRTTFFLSAG
jgi:hypothetical protein